MTPPIPSELPIADAAARLGVSKSRVSQLLNTPCTLHEPPIFELESPQGRPLGTTHVFSRTISVVSIEAYDERHPAAPSGRRRRHPAWRQVSLSESNTEHQGVDSRASGSPPEGLQTLRLELEHQLSLNREMRESFALEQEQALERARELRHRVVDLETDLELETVRSRDLSNELAEARSAFRAYGEIFTQDLGPQDPSGL